LPLQSVESFNPRPCARGDKLKIENEMLKNAFQSTPLREGRRPTPGGVCGYSVFQSTPLREGRPTQQGQGTTHMSRFNPRPCARGDPMVSSFSTWLRRFNPRPCARGDGARQGAHRQIQVSIHAPARGATAHLYHLFGSEAFQSTPLREGRHLKKAQKRQMKNVSIHAPARGATTSSLISMSYMKFQSTPLREGRHLVKNDVNNVIVVSIHAPARGATVFPTPNPLPYTSFNPRPCARGDLIIMQLIVMHQWFQSTPLREGRHSNRFSKGDRNHVSIHAPARGATSIPLLRHMPLFPFQSTPLREGRLAPPA